MTKPTILLIRPFAGHTADIMSNTIKVLEKDFVVVMPDVPHETYGEYLTALRALVIEHDNILGVCQGGVGALMALGILDDTIVLHKRLVLIGTPVNTSIPSRVGKFILSTGLEKLVQGYSMLGKVRGHLLTLGFMSLDPVGHMKKLSKIWYDKKIQKFYKMYFNNEDMTQEFFKDSLKLSYFDNMNQHKAYIFAGHEINYSMLGESNQIMTVEGKKDDITTIGQTSAVFALLPTCHKKTSIVIDAGHYGCFSGSKFKNTVYPKIKDFFS